MVDNYQSHMHKKLSHKVSSLAWPTHEKSGRLNSGVRTVLPDPAPLKPEVYLVYAFAVLSLLKILCKKRPKSSISV